jgi:hypothetical protein
MLRSFVPGVEEADEEERDDDCAELLLTLGQMTVVTTVLLVLLLRFGSVVAELTIAVLYTLPFVQGVTCGTVKLSASDCVPGAMVPS